MPSMAAQLQWCEELQISAGVIQTKWALAFQAGNERHSNAYLLHVHPGYLASKGVLARQHREGLQHKVILPGSGAHLGQLIAWLGRRPGATTAAARGRGPSWHERGNASGDAHISAD